MRRDDTCVADPSSKKMVLYMAYHNKILAMDQTGKIHRQVKPLAPETLYIFAQREALFLRERSFWNSVEISVFLYHSDFT